MVASTNINYEDVIKGVGDPQADEVRCGRVTKRREAIRHLTRRREVDRQNVAWFNTAIVDSRSSVRSVH